MAKKNVKIIVVVVILICLAGSIFFVWNSQRDKQIVFLAETLNSESVFESKAEKELLEIGKPAIKPLRRVLRNKLLLLKYSRFFRMFGTVFKFNKDKSKTFNEFSSNYWLIRHIAIIKKVLNKLGDKTVSDTDSISTILDYIDRNHVGENDIKAFLPIFQSSGKSAVLAIFKRIKSDRKINKPEILRYLLLHSVNEDSINILVSYLNDKDKGIRYLAADMLGYTESKRAENVWFCCVYPQKEYKIMLMNQELFMKRIDAVECNNYSPIINNLFQDEIIDCRDNGMVVKKKIESLHTKFRNTRAVKILIKALDDPEFFGRMAVIRSLGLIGDNQAVVPITKFLDKDNDTAREAVIALGYLGDERGVKPVLKYINSMKSCPNPDDIYYPIRTLGLTGSNEAVQPLIDFVNKDFPGNFQEIMEKLDDDKKKDFVYVVRSYSSQSLGFLGDKRAVEPLIKALMEHKFEYKFYNKGISYYAAFSLGLIGDERALEPLKESLDHPDADKEIIKWAINEIEGKWKSDSGRRMTDNG